MLQEREQLLQQFSEILRGRAISIILSGIGLFALTRIFVINQSVTGYVIGASASNNSIAVMLSYFVLLIGAFGLLIYMHGQKIKGKIETAKRKITKKYPNNSASGLMNKKVYSNGHYLGKVRDVVLKDNKIESLKINVDKKHKFRAKGMIISYSHVRSVREIIIVDDKIHEQL